eukprot:s1164_g10.t1
MVGGPAWCLLGHWNLVPAGNWFNDVVCCEGASVVVPDGETATWWEGNRVIDSAVTTLPGVHSWCLPTRWSDHKAVAFNLNLVQLDVARAWEVVDQLEALQPSSNHLVEHVDSVWEQLQSIMQSVLREVRLLACRPTAEFRAKGRAPSLRERLSHHQRPYLDHASNEFSVLLRLYGRMSECVRQGCDFSSVRRIRRCRFWTSELTLADVASRIKVLEQRDKARRIARWKAKMQTDPDLYRWLRGRQPSYTQNVHNDESSDVSVSSDIREVLDTLVSFWSAIWFRDGSAESDIQAYLAQTEEPFAVEVWPAVSAFELRDACSRQRGKAAGLDGSGRRAAALSSLVLVRVCAGPACVRVAWCLPVRPISIFSVLWRVYASARIKSASAAQWINRVLPSALCGGRSGSDVLSIMLEVFEHVDNNRYLGSLDFSKAFDHVRPSSAGAAMAHTGCPAALVRGIQRVWWQRRLLCWGSSVHHEFMEVTESMPQGDPFAVLALSLLLRVPVLKLQARFPRLLQVIYVDDRTWCCDSAAECAEVWDFWQHESVRLGFRENHSKAQFFHRTVQGRKALRTRGCAALHTATILGVEISSSDSRGSSKKELARVQRAMSVLRKCCYLQHGVLRKAQVYERGYECRFLGLACSSQKLG